MRPTLVQRDFNGRLTKPQLPPEEAALALLTLDPEARARADGVLASRAAILDRIVRENVELIIQLYNAGQAGDRPEQLRLLGQFAAKLEPLQARGSLETELAAAIPADQTPLFRSILEEYRTALTEDLALQARSTGQRPPRPRAAAARLALATLGLEIKRSYERQIGGKAAEFERLLARLSLSPELEARIRTQVTDWAQKTKGNPTEADKRALFVSLLSQLNAEQRRTLIREALGQPESAERPAKRGE
ncbi:MAG: hypothetical protein WD749_09635 [Phycisphaerales bacterium]